jgi:general secretion pathway protein H
MSGYVRAKGFTLIEILVVVAIIAIVTAAVVLSMGVIGDDRDSRTEVRRLATLIEVAQDEATMQGREFGLELLTGGYRFVEYDPLAVQWVDIPGDETLRPRNLSEGVTIELFMEDKRVTLEEELADLRSEEDNRQSLTSYAPHGLIFSSGDMTPMEIRMAREEMEEPIVLTIDALGQIEITSGEPQ